MRRSSLLLVLLTGLVPGCRSAPGGPTPAPDAIVEGRVDPGVHTDTIEDRASVTLDRARWALRPQRDPTLGFWDDIAVLDIPAAERAARSADQRTFALALRTLMASDPDAAAVAFGALRATASDVVVRGRARVGLTMALSWGSDWPALARIAAAEPDTSFAVTDTIAMLAGVERWARALAAIPPPIIDVPVVPITLPMRRSAFGTPVITVRVNGKPHDFWLDTGASMTLLSSSVALDAGVLLAAPDTLALGVVAGHIPARAVYMESLAIGSMVARGLTAALVDPSVLRLDRRVVNGIPESIQIDGVIGTDLLRHMDIVLDAGAETITIRQPRRDLKAQRNLYWVGYPVVRLVSRDGRPMLFGLDTGAEGTYVTTTLLKKMPSTRIAARRGVIGGLGAEKQRTEWVARDVALSDGDYALTLRNVPVTPERRWTFLNFDGVIGSDVALATRMHLDFVNGIFDVRKSAYVPPGSAANVTVTH
jgi:hypothetical protein